MITNNKKNNLSSGKLIKAPVYIGLFGAVMMLSGCNTSTADLDEYFISQREKAPAPIAPIPEVKPYLRYAYPAHEKDPFDVSMLAPNIGPKEVVLGNANIDTSRVPEFLEGFPLDSLKMVGTVKKNNTLWALIKIPDGAVQTVKSGNYMGQNYGKIVSISDTQMEMQETVSNGLGGYKEREISITLDQL